MRACGIYSDNTRLARDAIDEHVQRHGRYGRRETMDCTHLPPLTEDEICAAIDQVASPSVLSHLERCPGCAARVEQGRRLEHALARALYRFECVDAQRLGEFALDLADDEEARVLREHLAWCAPCGRELAELQTLLEVAPVSQTEQALEAREGHRRAQAPQLPLRERLAAWLPRFEEIIAVLVSPPPALASVRAVRGAETEAAPIEARAGDTEITLEVRDRLGDGRVVVYVQVIPPMDPKRPGTLSAEWNGALVTLRQQGEIRATGTLSDDGFLICTLPAGPPCGPTSPH